MSWAPRWALPGLPVLLFCGHLAQATVLAGSRHATNSFTDYKRLICMHGPPGEVEAALATLKSSPKARLYLNAWAYPGTNCVLRGYKYQSKEQPCFPGVTVFFRDEDSQAEFFALRDEALRSYQEDYKLDNATMGLLTACSCDPESSTYQRNSARCQSLNITASWVHTNEVSDNAYSCHEGPYEHMLRALSVMKSSRLLSFHLRDQISVLSCAQRGFAHPMTSSKDPTGKCYPPARGFFESTLLMQDYHAARRAIIADSFFNNFVDDMGLDRNTLGSNPECDCLSESYAGANVNR
eukprot:CAMPEP_0179342518 /NCGR_PEP_ID=MMETSP0797-20121207/70445_1 /TAXON_ID=47934 /ORGANISM="Dinophysis acuminata, Strain DAEP01" /LENGTH=294 /DNA_ID=CAMNT_0021056729 /DNA_START=1 /DNA_END=882 /DNA_ORIENTATION=-